MLPMTMKIGWLVGIGMPHDLTFLDFSSEASEPIGSEQREHRSVISLIVRHYENLPAEGWQQYINCGQWPTTGGPTHAIPLPNLFTKRVPIT